MNAKAFLDTNVIVYAFSSNDPRREQALALVTAGGIVSVQVLIEFVNVSCRKARREWTEIQEALALLKALLDTPQPITIELHEAAVMIARDYRYRIYDSLIIAAALRADCSFLYSEDLHHGQKIDRLTIHNPFARGEICLDADGEKRSINRWAHLFQQSLCRRRDLGDEVAHQRLVGKRCERHLARLEPRGAGVDRLAVELDHAFLAGIGVDAGVADRQARVAIGPDPAQPVEHRLAGLERHLVSSQWPRGTLRAAPYLSVASSLIDAAARCAAPRAIVMPLACEPAIWFAAIPAPFGKILALVRAAALLARERRRGDAARRRAACCADRTIRAGAGRTRSASPAGSSPSARVSSAMRGKRACEPRGGAQRADVVGHHRLRALDHRRPC